MAALAGDRERGLQLYREALQLYHDASNPRDEARVLVFIAELERQRGNEPAARAAFESAMERARAAGESRIEELAQKALSAPPASSP
jgi:tetratricopeptide (TPR) repeat protein